MPVIVQKVTFEGHCCAIEKCVTPLWPLGSILMPLTVGTGTDHSRSGYGRKLPFEQHHCLHHQNVVRSSPLDRRC